MLARLDPSERSNWPIISENSHSERRNRADDCDWREASRAATMMDQARKIRHDGSVNVIGLPAGRLCSDPIRSNPMNNSEALCFTGVDCFAGPHGPCPSERARTSGVRAGALGWPFVTSERATESVHLLRPIAAITVLTHTSRNALQFLSIISSRYGIS